MFIDIGNFIYHLGVSMFKKIVVLFAFYTILLNPIKAQLNLLHSFSSSTTNGQNPTGSLLLDGTYLYGMTEQGGMNGYGTIFRIGNDGNDFILLFSFSATITDGYAPVGSLIKDGIYLYGMAHYGGTTNDGIIFRIDKDGSGFTILHNMSYTNGRYPRGSLTTDSTYLYGMTEQGGSGDGGTIFRINKDGSGFTLLHSFVFSTTNGRLPQGTLLIMERIFLVCLIEVEQITQAQFLELIKMGVDLYYFIASLDLHIVVDTLMVA